MKSLKKILKKNVDIINTHNQFIYVNSLSNEIKESILSYTTYMYSVINDYLENKTQNNEKLNKIIKDIDIAIKNAPPLQKDLIVYRVLNLPVIKSIKYKNKLLLLGYKGLYKGYISTSLDKNVTNIFLNKDNEEEVSSYLFKICVKKGTRCLFIESISNFESEQEVLLPRNSIISIVKLSNLKIEGELSQILV